MRSHDLAYSLFLRYEHYLGDDFPKLMADPKVVEIFVDLDRSDVIWAIDSTGTARDSTFRCPATRALGLATILAAYYNLKISRKSPYFLCRLPGSHAFISAYLPPLVRNIQLRIRRRSLPEAHFYMDPHVVDHGTLVNHLQKQLQEEGHKVSNYALYRILELQRGWLEGQNFVESVQRLN